MLDRRTVQVVHAVRGLLKLHMPSPWISKSWLGLIHMAPGRIEDRAQADWIESRGSAGRERGDADLLLYRVTDRNGQPSGQGLERPGPMRGRRWTLVKQWDWDSRRRKLRLVTVMEAEDGCDVQMAACGAGRSYEIYPQYAPREVAQARQAHAEKGTSATRRASLSI